MTMTLLQVEGRESQTSAPSLTTTMTIDTNDNKMSLHTGGSVAEWLACWTQAQKGLG